MPITLPHMAIPKIDTNNIKNFVSRYLKFSPQKPAESEPLRRTGLNIGRSSLTACEIVWRENQPVLERCARKQIVPDQPLADQIKNFFSEAGFKSKRVSISLKGQGVVIRFLSFPKMSRSDFSSSIRYEAEKYLPFSLSDVIFDYHMVETPVSSQEEGTMSVILTAARKTEIERLIQTLQTAGLKPDLIDIDILACVNAFQFANPDAKNHCVGLIDLGATDSSFGILNKGTLTFSRDIAFGGADLTEMIHRKSNISHEAAFELQAKLDKSQADQAASIEEGLGRLFQEIKSSITYYYNQHQGAAPLETIYISGGFSQLATLSDLLEKQLELPVKTWNAVAQIKLGEQIDKNLVNELNPYLPVCIGLAIRPR